MESKAPIQLDLGFSPKATLLVVDDDADTREILKAFFSARGYEVLTADDGTAALGMIHAHPEIQVALLDIFIPVIGGLQVLREIYALNDRPTVILLTGLADREVAHDALRLGAFDYILKPFDIGRLEAAVEVGRDDREYRKQTWWKRFISRAS